MSDNVAKFSIQLVDEFGKTLGVFNKGIDGAYNKVNKLNASLKKGRQDPFSTQAKSLAVLRDRVERYRTAAENSFRLDHVRKYNRLIEETEKKIRGIEDAAKGVGKQTEEVFYGGRGGMNGIFAAGLGIMAAKAVSDGVRKGLDLSKESIAASSQIEKYEVSLKNMLGTTEAARDRMQEYFDIAKKTPFDMPQVVETGNQLQALGRYSRENVTMLGDLAAASGKPMEQALSAFAKMASGQKGIAVDMFRNLMITVDDWTEATGKGVSKNGELLATTEELIAVLPQIMKKKGFFGLMATQAETTEGKVSNLNDALFQLKVAAGDRMKPAYNSFVSGASRAVDKMQRWVEIPIEQKIASEKAGLNALVGALIESNDNEEKRRTIIDELQSKYPSFISNIDLEKASTEELRKELEKTNKEYDKKMRKAAFQRQISALETDMGDKMDDITKYELSIQAKKNISRLKSQQKNLLKQILGDKDELYRYSFDSDGNVKYTPQSINGNMPLPQTYTVNMTEEQRQQAIVLKAEENAYHGFTTFWKNDEKGKLEAQKGYEEMKARKDIIKGMYDSDETEARKELLKKAQAIDAEDKSTYAKLFGKKELKEEFVGLVKSAASSFEDVTDEQWQRMSAFVDGRAKYSKTMSPTDALDSKLESAGGVITGGGRSVKHITINVESLIGVNNNMFESGETPTNKDAFLDQLKSALFGVLNDANAVA